MGCAGVARTSLRNFSSILFGPGALHALRAIHLQVPLSFYQVQRTRYSLFQTISQHSAPTSRLRLGKLITHQTAPRDLPKRIKFPY
jgi:hypothetical protein